MSKKQPTHEDNFGQIEEVLTRGEQFLERNQKLIINVLIIAVVLIVAYFGYKKFIHEPQVTEASNQIFGAQNYFEKDSFNLALNGDGNILGFAEIAKKYDSTPSGNLAHYYSGLCCLYTGDYNNAIKSFEKFSSDDLLLGNMAVANIGDAYMQLGDFNKAAYYYKKASESKMNEFSTPVFLMKYGLALEKANKFGDALKAYEKLDKEFPNTPQGREIEKYITRIQLKMK